MTEHQSETGREEEFNPYAQPTRHVREEPETERKKGRRRWGCGCLVVSALGLWAAIQIPSYLAYRERQGWRTVPEESLRGACDGLHGKDTLTLQSAVIGKSTYSGFSPVHGCRDLKDYHDLAKMELRHYVYDVYVQTEGAAEAAREERERFKRRFDDFAAQGKCRAMPAGARVEVVECCGSYSYAPYVPRVRLEGEGDAWWVACSGLKRQ